MEGLAAGGPDDAGRWRDAPSWVRDKLSRRTHTLIKHLLQTDLDRRVWLLEEFGDDGWSDTVDAQMLLTHLWEALARDEGPLHVSAAVFRPSLYKLVGEAVWRVCSMLWEEEPAPDAAPDAPPVYTITPIMEPFCALAVRLLTYLGSRWCTKTLLVMDGVEPESQTDFVSTLHISHVLVCSYAPLRDAAWLAANHLFETCSDIGVLCHFWASK